MRIALLCLLLAGCASANNEVALKMLDNIEHCERQYTLGLGVGAVGSMVVKCPAMPYAQ